MLVSIRNRYMLDRFRCIDTVETFKAVSYFVSGNIYYFRLDRFNIKSVGSDELISIEE